MASESGTARQGLDGVAAGNPDLVILDLGLPDMSGLEFIRDLRTWSRVPILILSARSAEQDKIAALDAGADDYLTKPFAMPELMARVAALGRRNEPGHHDSVLRVGDLEFDLIRRHVKRGGEILELQPQDERLLEVLMRNAGRVVTRTMLLEQVWDFNFDPKTSIVETQISRLRSKIDRAAEPSMIETLRGSGYRFRNAR
jgi:two-component system OmpR family response regulator